MARFDNLTADQRLQWAANQLITERSAFWGGISHMPFVENPQKSETLATDGLSVFYKPEFVATLDKEDLIGVVLHGWLHPALDHFARSIGLEPDLANQAGDHEINHIIKKAGFKLPKDALCDPAYADMEMEKIYGELQKRRQKKGNQSGQQGNLGQGSQQPPGSGQGAPGQPQQGQTPSQGQWQPASGQQPGQDQGQAWGQMLPPTNPDGTPASPADVSNLSGEWKQRVRIAAKIAQKSDAPGATPGFVAELVENIRKPKADWRTELREFMSKVRPSSSTWRRPNRRMLSAGIHLPSTVKEGMREIVLAIDTSGSVDTEALEQFAGEMTAINEDLRPEKITIIYCDRDIQGVVEIEAGEEVKLEAPGRGGTDFRPVFEYVAQLEKEPACLVFFTDMENTGWPETEPDYPVLWASWGKKSWNDKAPFGRVVVVK